MAASTSESASTGSVTSMFRPLKREETLSIALFSWLIFAFSVCRGSPVTKGVAKEVVVAMGRGGWGRQISGTIAPALYPFHGEEGQGETCTVPKISLLRRPRRSIR
ncbi:hypothetical protein GW17_00035248 [Ensete ventricosum]|nr:hypothetical protein GW17_00035248 [Ensete ventricosum]